MKLMSLITSTLLILSMSGCITPDEPKKEIKIDKPEEKYKFVAKGAQDNVSTITTNMDTANKALTETQQNVGKASSGVNKLVDQTKVNMSNDVPKQTIADQMDQKNDEIQKELESAKTNCTKAQTELAMAQTTGKELTTKVIEITSQLAESRKSVIDAAAALEEQKKVAASDKEKLKADMTAAHKLEMDALIAAHKKETDKLTSENASLKKDLDTEKTWWKPWLNAFVYAGSFLIGLGGIAILIFIKDRQLAFEVMGFGAAIPITYFAWNGIFKAEPYVKVIFAAVVVAFVLRMALALYKKSKAVVELVKTVDIAKKSTDWSKDRVQALEVQSDSTIEQVQALKKSLNLTTSKPPIVSSVVAGLP